MDDTRFDELADRTLQALLRALDGVDGLEAELSQGVMSISFDAGGTVFVVNSHRAARQIWMAAVATAWHFDPVDGGTWRAPKTGEELRPTLARVLRERIGLSLAL